MQLQKSYPMILNSQAFNGNKQFADAAVLSPEKAKIWSDCWRIDVLSFISNVQLDVVSIELVLLKSGLVVQLFERKSLA